MMRLALIALLAVSATAQPARRALLIGIDDYTASSLPIVSAVHQHPGWPDLRGGANDVRILSDLLVLRYGFERKNIVTLTNQQATRAAILHAIEEHLVHPARKGDIVFYYFAGHGAQVPNAASDEPDRLDESIVPADSRRGAADIRDKELRPLFNRILQRGARLTLLLDHCHSGGGFRGLPNGAPRRGIGPSPPIVDAHNYGPRPDEHGALVLASTQDSDSAWETRGEDGLMHGAFTWAWIRAMRDAVAGEAAQEIFLRAQARLRGETPYQSPVMLGNADARLRPFLGVNRSGDRTVIAVEAVQPDGQIVLQGGWAHGLAVDSELSPLVANGPNNRSQTADRRPQAPTQRRVVIPPCDLRSAFCDQFLDHRTRLQITRLLGLGRSIARLSSGPAVSAGTLLAIVLWAPQTARPLRLFAPRVTANVDALARRFAAATKAKWIVDPLEVSPTHMLRPRDQGWELLDRNGRSIAFANDEAAIDAIAHLRTSDSLFVQLPPSETIVSDGDANGDAQLADYVLTVRLHGDRVQYAWIRPFMRNSDRRASGLPLRTAWTSDPNRLRRDVAILRRIHDWFSLTTPPDTSTPYHLALRDESTKELVRDDVVTGKRVYSLILRSSGPIARTPALVLRLRRRQPRQQPAPLSEDRLVRKPLSALRPNAC